MSAPRDLLVVGAGGFARETIAAIGGINDAEPTWNLLGVLDDDPARAGVPVAGTRILGGSDLVHEHPDALVIVCTGRPGDYASRLRISQRLALTADRYATIVHPSASIGAGSTLGPGTVVLSHVTLTTDVQVGHHVAVMPQVVLTHDDILGDFVTVTSGVRLGGGVQVGTGAYLGAGALIREGVRIGAWSQLGMGSLLLEDVPDHRVWFGSPARDVRPAIVDLGVLAPVVTR